MISRIYSFNKLQTEFLIKKLKNITACLFSSACHNLCNDVKKHIILNLCLLFPSHALISIPYQKSCDNAKLDAKHSGFVYLFFAKLCSSYLTIFDVIHYLNKTFCRFSEFELWVIWFLFGKNSDALAFICSPWER